LRTAFYVTVRARRFDALKSRKSDIAEFLGDLPDVPDPAAESAAETMIAYNQVLQKLRHQRHRDAIILSVTDIESEAKLTERTRRRHKTEAAEQVKEMFDPKKSKFFTFEPSTPLISILPGVTSQQICLLGFELDCPGATDADVARWSADFPKFASAIQRRDDDRKATGERDPRLAHRRPLCDCSVARQHDIGASYNRVRTRRSPHLEMLPSTSPDW
jgi:hypothetical protein